MTNFMTDNTYKDDEDIKLFIITKKNIPLISTIKSNGTNMKRTYKLDYYDNDYTCKYHIDYLQVLLNKYFKNTNLDKYIGNTNNDISEEIIKELVNNNNIVLSNTTLYNSINYKINNKKYGKIYINKDVKEEQIETLLYNKNLLSLFDYVDILIYKDNILYKESKLYNITNINLCKKLNDNNIKTKKLI